MPHYLKPVAEVAYITGWRTKSELLTRQWRHVDLANGWLRLDPGVSKNGEGREFPFTPELRAILQAQRDRVSELEKAIGQIVPWVVVHDDGTPIRDFRERASVPRSAAMKLTGHKTEAVYRRYAITDSAMLQEAALKLAILHAAEASTEENRKSIEKVSAIATAKR
jgi:integrase